MHQCSPWCIFRCIFHILVSKVLVWHHCHHVWTRQSRPSPFFLRANKFSIVTANASCRLCHARAAFTSADGKVPESATGDFALFCHLVHGFKEDYISFFVTFVLVSCSRVCLLDVSRPHGLTLRLFAPVCSCPRASLTRLRLEIVQESVRVFYFCIFSIGPCT